MVLRGSAGGCRGWRFDKHNHPPIPILYIRDGEKLKFRVPGETFNDKRKFSYNGRLYIIYAAGGGRW